MRDAHDKEIIARALAESEQLSPRRGGIIAHLVPLVGLEPQDQAYQDAVYRYDPPARRRALALHQSGCGLVMEYGWEGGGVPVDDRIRLGADKGHEVRDDAAATRAKLLRLGERPRDDFLVVCVPHVATSSPVFCPQRGHSSAYLRALTSINASHSPPHCPHPHSEERYADGVTVQSCPARSCR
jgi:hypothetical protein